jgi:PhoPQ-activated pathogenicity-related protein
MLAPHFARNSLLFFAVLGAVPAATGAELFDYVRRPEPNYSWKVQGKTQTPGGTVYDLKLVSQVWHDITWTHQLQIYQPKDVRPQRTMLLFNTGGTAGKDMIAIGLELARKTRAPVAILYNIPNQPLFGGKTEDGLIAETFVRYLETKDGSWPLLFPMVKSVVKAMDAVQSFAKEEWKEPVEGFVISGASKRGWTTWLTGAADPRVKAIAPLVIDTLNMGDQMEHQKRSFGTYSEQIADYTERRLVPVPDTAEARRLWGMVDPYFYRDRIAQPKLLILGNNDPYWTVDALNLYWDGLKGEKYVTYVPNAGHDLRQGGKNGSLTRALGSLEAFARLEIEGKPLPKISWKHEQIDGKYQLTATASPAPLAARLWRAAAPTRDFRSARWDEKPATLNGGTASGLVGTPASGYEAFYLDLDFDAGGLTYHLCTQIRVVECPAKGG